MPGCVWLCLAIACDDGNRTAPSEAAQAEQHKAAEKKAAEEKAEQEVRARAEAAKRQAEEEERAYQAAKGALEPLAKLPKKHPKGFATACAAMLEQYDAFMQRSLQGDALAKWNDEDKKGRTPVLRRECHKRAVPVVVCQTAILEKASAETDVDHIVRLCTEKFG